MTDLRRKISETALSAGMGPVSLDLEIARDHGWTQGDLEDFWGDLMDLYWKAVAQIEKRGNHHSVIMPSGGILFAKGMKPDRTRTPFQRADIDVMIGSPAGGKETASNTVVEDAYIVGQWAAHKTVTNAEAFGAWSVTHIPTGLRIPYYLEHDTHALCAAVYLYRRLGKVSARDTQELGYLVESTMALADGFEEIAEIFEGRATFVPARKRGRSAR